MTFVVANDRAGAQSPPVGATAAPLVAPDSDMPKTPWGDPDLRGTWPLQNINDARIRLERPAEMGTRAELTDKEFAERLREAEISDAAYTVELRGGGTTGLADWLRATPFGRRTSLIVRPADGRLPPLTPQAAELYAKGRSTWRSVDVVNWISDLDPFERCITRGFPAVMLPQPYNNGIRVFQSPGYVVLQLETFGARVIPLGRTEPWPSQMRAWHGNSRGHWEGDTLVIETTNIVSGDSATTDLAKRAAGPIPGRENATLPVGPEAKVTERLTRTGRDTIAYRMTYDDPAVFTAPWTADLQWTRDESYTIFEYACHERNTVTEAITGSRAKRRTDAAAVAGN
ncbi:hypothetical protein H0274_14735 [Altererythrobacter sp. CC-YST694]|uniref:hypothetical protein n=1 Tax=Altererythrobacter sp. CC-YST694 TaxID=2755038 RepID=UPI001D0114A8|nr:hypothetical protein [Altererythrobacter sp. CC-YST694]MCB5426517.1 hypothetical protein [Altererythrobacter sp. CC-YST694]